jgi:hypothetical protein
VEGWGNDLKKTDDFRRKWTLHHRTLGIHFIQAPKAYRSVLSRRYRQIKISNHIGAAVGSEKGEEYIEPEGVCGDEILLLTPTQHGLAVLQIMERRFGVFGGSAEEAADIETVLGGIEGYKRIGGIQPQETGPQGIHRKGKGWGVEPLCHILHRQTVDVHYGEDMIKPLGGISVKLPVIHQVADAVQTHFVVLRQGAPEDPAMGLRILSSGQDLLQFLGEVMVELGLLCFPGQALGHQYLYFPYSGAGEEGLTLVYGQTHILQLFQRADPVQLLVVIIAVTAAVFVGGRQDAAEFIVAQSVFAEREGL